MTPNEQASLDSRLIDAARDGDTQTVRTLFTDGANVHADEDAALRWASSQGHTETVKVLLAIAADIHADKDAPVYWAARNGHTETVKALLASSADVHAEDDRALRLAAYWGHTEVVKALLGAGADLHADNDVALRWAAHNGHTETLRVLQEALKNEVARRLELERQQNPLYAGTGLTFSASGPEDVEALLCDAMTEQSSSVSALTPLAPASARSFPLCFAQPGGAQPERPDRREHIPLPLCP